MLEDDEYADGEPNEDQAMIFEAFCSWISEEKGSTAMTGTEAWWAFEVGWHASKRGY